jgi:hypothetical protein
VLFTILLPHNSRCWAGMNACPCICFTKGPIRARQRPAEQAQRQSSCPHC